MKLIATKIAAILDANFVTNQFTTVDELCKHPAATEAAREIILIRGRAMFPA
jgi:hypothetical protein